MEWGHELAVLTYFKSLKEYQILHMSLKEYQQSCKKEVKVEILEDWTGERWLHEKKKQKLSLSACFCILIEKRQ